MKKGILFFILAGALLLAAVIVGLRSPSAEKVQMQAREQAQIAGNVGGEVPTAVLPPEQLSQFKNISVYTPQKRDDSTFFINPRDEEMKPSKGSETVKKGIM